MKWDELGKLLASAVAVVGAVFGLFNSVLSELAPPVSGMGALGVTGMASLLALVILLVLVLTLRQRLLAARRGWVVGVSAGLAVLGLAVFFVYYGELDAHVFRWPQGEAQAPRYVRGEWSELGRLTLRDMSVSEAITQMGGLEMVRSQQLLWEEASAKRVEQRLLGLYWLMTCLFVSALFGLLGTLLGGVQSEEVVGEVETEKGES